MIKNIIDLLNMSDFYGINEKIDIAKGKYQIPRSFKQGKKQLKRVIKSKK
jgi:hypothetical protein